MLNLRCPRFEDIAHVRKWAIDAEARFAAAPQHEKLPAQREKCRSSATTLSEAEPTATGTLIGEPREARQSSRSEDTSSPGRNAVV